MYWKSIELTINGEKVEGIKTIDYKTIKMKITASKIKRELHKNYGWDNLDSDANKFMVKELIKDTISVIDGILKIHKNITIKK